jgi:hypothetical protein
MKLLFTHLVILLSFSSFGQARLVINGGIISINNGAALVIDNPDNDAITTTGVGYIFSEAANNRVIWSVGEGGAGAYLVPFGNASGKLPLQFNASSGSANGRIEFSTYRTATWKNSDYLPPGVTNVNGGGGDNSAKLVDRFWQINPQGYVIKPTLTNVIFTYADIELNAPNTITESNLVTQRWNNASLTWGDFFPVSIINTSTNTIAIPTIQGNQLYDWWTLVDASTPLPVTLLNFKAVVNNKKVVTSWQTSSENNTSHFEIWRSKDLRQFDSVAKLAAAGNSASLLNYSFTDAAPYTGISYYRLKTVGLDRSFKWSAIVKVYVGDGVYVSLSPNPAITNISLTVSNSIANAKPLAYLYDAKGSLLQSFKIVDTYQTVNISLLPVGIYHIQFMYNEKTQTLSFIKK